MRSGQFTFAVLLFMLLDLYGEVLGSSEWKVQQFNIPQNAAIEKVVVNFTSSLHECHTKFLSVTIDSAEVNEKWHGFPFGSAKLQNMAAALSPTDFRLGGTKADFLIFDPEESAKDTEAEKKTNTWAEYKYAYKYDSGYFDDPWKATFDNFTMTGKQWDTMTVFLQKVGWDLMFDFNLFKWKKNGLWDPSNADLLLNYSAAKNIKIPYFQLGNEPNSFQHNFNFSISPETLAKDFQILKQLISKYKLYSSGLLFGPDVTNLDRHSKAREYLEGFITAGAYDIVHEYSLHHYYMNGETATLEDFFNVTIMDSLKNELEQALNIAQHGPVLRPIRLTETSSCYGGGAPGLSDAYVAGFLWLDKLGLAAQYGVTRVFRQTFFGGSYSLISPHLEPNPDFFLSVLYKNLVEGPVFNVTVEPPNMQLRVYAHCTRKGKYPLGALVIYYLNLSDRETTLSFSQFQNEELHVYLLTPGDTQGLKSKFVKLNGEILKMSGSELPPLRPKVHQGDITVEAHSFGFIVVPHAGVRLCQSYHYH